MESRLYVKKMDRAMKRTLYILFLTVAFIVTACGKQNSETGSSADTNNMVQESM